jgi:hypothetical protein
MEDGNPTPMPNDKQYSEFLYAQSDSSNHSAMQMLSPETGKLLLKNMRSTTENEKLKLHIVIEVNEKSQGGTYEDLKNCQLLSQIK